MFPVPLILLAAVMIGGAVHAEAERRKEQRRRPRTGPDTGDIGWPWSKEWYLLHARSPGSSGRGVYSGPYELTHSAAQNWMLDHLETQTNKEWTLLVWRNGTWQRTT